VVVALSLNVANVVGYTKCEKDARQKLTSLAGQYISTSLMQQAVGAVASLAFGGAGSNAQGGATRTTAP
jgi:uncharacterized membrane protein